jgi:predicted lipoprotein with Yx(FWY)xxD motif
MRRRFRTQGAARFTAALCIAIFAVPAFGSEVALPTDVKAQEVGHGTRLTDVEWYTLYTYDLDLGSPGESICTGPCAELHPAFLASGTIAELPRDWSIIVRGDGSQQWAFKGRPLYRYARDLDPGAVFGDIDGWNVAFEPMIKPAEFAVRETVLGQVLTLQNGRTVYATAAKPPGKFECDTECEQTWQPVRAPWTSHGAHGFTVIQREDGLSQWAYNDSVLYTYAGDAGAGDLAGHDHNDGWRAVVLEPAAPAPDWVTVVGSDGGELYGDSTGMTLYRLMIDQNNTEQAYLGGNQCNAECLDRYWTPVASASPQPRVGYWSVIESQHGGWQWAYKGMPLYLLTLETRPGQLFYTTFRQFQWMKPIMYELPALQGVF